MSDDAISEGVISEQAKNLAERFDYYAEETDDGYVGKTTLFTTSLPHDPKPNSDDAIEGCQEIVAYWIELGLRSHDDWTEMFEDRIDDGVDLKEELRKDECEILTESEEEAQVVSDKDTLSFPLLEQGEWQDGVFVIDLDSLGVLLESNSLLLLAGQVHDEGDRIAFQVNGETVFTMLPESDLNFIKRAEDEPTVPLEEVVDDLE